MRRRGPPIRIAEKGTPVFGSKSRGIKGSFRRVANEILLEVRYFRRQDVRAGPLDDEADDDRNFDSRYSAGRFVQPPRKLERTREARILRIAQYVGDAFAA